MRHPSCQLVVSATENSGRREGRWVLGWEGPADAVRAMGMYRWGCRDGRGAVPVEGSGLRFYSRNTGSHVCSHQVTRLSRGAAGHSTVWAGDLEPFSAAVHAPEDIRLPSTPAALPTRSPCLALVKACWRKKPHTHPVLPAWPHPCSPLPDCPLAGSCASTFNFLYPILFFSGKIQLTSYSSLGSPEKQNQMSFIIRNRLT